MDKVTKELLDRLLKESSATNSFLNDDHLNLPEDKSTRQMVIDMIAEGLEETDWRLVLQRVKF